MRTAAFAIALLLSSAAFAQTTTTTTTEPAADVDVGVQPDGDPDVDLDVGTKKKTTTHHSDGTVVTSTTDNVGDDAGTTQTEVTTGTTTTGTTTHGTTTHGTMNHGTMNHGTTVATNATAPMSPVVHPSNAAPERDARGIPVISDPAVVPAGFNGTAGTGVGGPLVDPATGATATGADTSHPACSRTVTDNCVQTYERGRRR